jgi:hypothetical protein
MRRTAARGHCTAPSEVFIKGEPWTWPQLGTTAL